MPEQWDQKKQLVRKQHPLAARYNAQIKRMRLDIEKHFLDGGSWTELLAGKDSAKLIGFLQAVIAEKGFLRRKFYLS